MEILPAKYLGKGFEVHAQQCEMQQNKKEIICPKNCTKTKKK